MDPSDVPGTDRTLRLEFTQADFDAFARISGDDNPIHVDPEFATRTRFGTTVAHGMLLLSHLWARTLPMVGDLRLTEQGLMFPAPTLAGAPLVMRLSATPGADATVRVAQEIATADGTSTATGEATFGMPRPAFTGQAGTWPVEAMRGIRLGDRTIAHHRFGADDVAAWWTLVGGVEDGEREGEVPPPLLCGLVSKLLGTDLPGEGTNWLKAHYRFLEPVGVGSEVTGAVEVVRLRPDKDLVDLEVRLDVDGRVVVDGRVLVLVGGGDSG